MTRTDIRDSVKCRKPNLGGTMLRRRSGKYATMDHRAPRPASSSDEGGSTAVGLAGTHEVAEPADQQAAVRRAWGAAAVTSAGLFLAVVSTTVVSVALPTITRDLHASATDLQWVVDAYVLVYASLLVTGGVIGDRFGRKGVFMLGIAIFGIGALLTGLAPSIGVLLAGRVIQGIGPALLVPGSLTIIRAAFEDDKRRAVAIGVWSMSAGVALAAGPVLGGVIVDNLGWRWVFLFNVPIAAVLVLVTAMMVRRWPRIAAQGRFDWLGAVLSTAGLALLVYATIEGQARGWTYAPVLAGFAGGTAALAAFIWWESRLARPLIDVSLFLNRQFAAANAAAFAVFFAFVGLIIYFSAYFQQVQGHSPLVAGLDVCAIGAALAVTSALAGPLVARVGERWPLLGGLFLSGAATLGLLRLGPATSVGVIWWDFALVGAGIGFCGTATTTMSMSAVDASRAGMASAVVNALRQVGQVFGVAVLGALVYAQLPGGGAGQRFSASQSSLFVEGLHSALWVCGLALLVVGAFAAVLVPGKARERRGTR
jgi:DHA2 family methylenomycin A resistance protein-like MFS transporter